jgi:hypothetical protein
MKINYRNYYLSLLLISIIWIFLGKQFYNNFAPIVFFIFGLPIFGFIYFSNLFKFSDLLKSKEPELFKRNAIHYGYFKDELINGSVFYSLEFNKLTDEDLICSYKKMKSSLNYMIASFISFGIIGILTVYIK